MKVEVRYLAQIRHAAGVSGEPVELDRSCSARELVASLAEHRAELRDLLLDDWGRLQATILVFVGDEQVGPEAVPLRDGDVVTVLAPMAGG